MPLHVALPDDEPLLDEPLPEDDDPLLVLLVLLPEPDPEWPPLVALEQAVTNAVRTMAV